MNKYKCDCGKLAVWVYLPGYGDEGNSYSCDECAHRGNESSIGCSCNWHYALERDGEFVECPIGVEGIDWKWVEQVGDEHNRPISKDYGYWIKLDERGRPHLCVEYDYSSDGFEVPTIFEKISWWFKHKYILFKLNYLN